MAASEDGPEAPTEELDVACGLENVPVSTWPPGARPEPFQVGGVTPPLRERRAWTRALIYGAGLEEHERCARSHGGGAGAFR